jgi:mono/diheme cytochrome c family protein
MRIRSVALSLLVLAGCSVSQGKEAETVLGAVSTAELRAQKPGALTLTPAALAGTPEEVDGKALFEQYCQACHVDSPAGGLVPDLRRSGMLASADGWKSVVIDGSRNDKGMYSFARVMTPAEAESVRRYVIDQAALLNSDVSAGPPR